MFRFRHNTGQAIAEFAIAFPVLLLLVLGIIQISFMFAARAVVEYAAFAASRAELVGEDAERAAEFVCTAIAGPTRVGGGRDIIVPGWGVIPRGLAASEKTYVDVLEPITNQSGAVTVEVTHLYELVVPVASMIFKPISTPLEPGHVPEDIFITYGGAPHMVMRARYTRPVPWDVEIQDAQGHAVISELEQ